jgi:CRP-like cAMP-binding protein
VVDDVTRQIDARLAELRDEVSRLEKARAALTGTTTTRRASSGSGSGRGRRRTTTGTGRRGRPKGSGTRARQALQLVQKQPGITIPELADKMGIKQNYLYRVMPGLAEQGLVVKSGRGWHTRDPETAAAPEPAA